jgi:hypothetical protein
VAIDMQQQRGPISRDEHSNQRSRLVEEAFESREAWFLFSVELFWRLRSHCCCYLFTSLRHLPPFRCMNPFPFPVSFFSSLISLERQVQWMFPTFRAT